MRRVRWLAGLVFGLSLASPSHAEPQRWLHNRWTTEDGLPQNSVVALATDGEGYLWLGTQEGLVRFDGQQLTVFGTESGIACPLINALATSQQGDLAVGTDACGAFLIRHSEVTRISSVPTDARVRAISLRADGALLFGTDRGLVISSATGSTSPYAQSEVTAIATTAQGEVFFAVHGGVAQLVGNSVSWLDPSRLPGDELTSLAVNGPDLWVASRDGVARSSQKGTTHFTLKDGLPSLSVQAIAVLDGDVWVATAAGAARFDGRRFVPLEVDDAPRNALSLLSGGPHQLWIGDSSTGLHQLRPRLIETFGTANGLIDPVVWSLFEDRGGTLWAGTEQGGIHRLEAGRFVPLAAIAGLESATVASFAQGPDGTIWAGTSAGLVHWDGARGELISQSAGLPSADIHSLAFDASGTLWIGTGRGLVRHDPDGLFVDVTAQIGISPTSCDQLAFDAEGHLWLGGPDLFGRVIAGHFSAQPLRGGRANIAALIATRRGVLAATATGLAEVRSGQVGWLEPSTGLFPSSIIGLSQTADETWFVTNRGPFRVPNAQLDDFFDGKLEQVSSAAYGVRDGMKNAECNSSSNTSVLAARDGRVWVPTVNGISVFDPVLLRSLPSSLRAQVESVRDPRRRIAPQHTSPATLEPGSRELEIQYSAPEFTTPAQVTFRYRLEGNDPDWVEAGSRRTAWYTNLKPGTYLFRVEARRPQGAWSSSPGVVEISIKPWLYETWWFRLMAGLLTAFAMVLIVRARSASLRAREAELQRRVEERTLELKVALERSAQSEASFRTLTDQLPIAVTVTSPHGHVVYANPEAVRLTGGESLDQLLTLSLPDFADPQEKLRWLSRSDQLGKHRATAMRVGRIKRLDGCIATAELWGIPVVYQGESSALSLARDITEQVALQQKLQSAERLASVGTLAAGVAHEINNPLAFVISNLSFIADETRAIVAAAKHGPVEDLGERWADADQALAEAAEGARRVQRIVSDLKTFSRPTEEADGPVALKSVIDFAINLCRNELRHRAQLVLELVDVPIAYGNANRLGQVLLNLLLNASQAIPDGAVNQNQITVRSGRIADGRIFIEVADTGCGIPRENLGRLFDPFFTTKPVGVGTGLGLSICHGILAACGGELQVESEPGKGSLFRVLLRPADGEAPREEITPPTVAEAVRHAPGRYDGAPLNKT